jgi:thiamine biosynthesis lipoprotein
MVNRYLFSRTILYFPFLAIVLIPLSVASQPVAPQRVERFAEAMGTTFSISVYASESQASEDAVEAAFAEAHRLDGMLSNYKPESELSQLNRTAAEGPVKVSRELFQLLQTCFDLSRASDGAFDMTVGPLMKLWGFYRGEGHVPDPQAISRAMQHVGYRNVLLDPKHETVRFLKAGIELDPGGVGKGYAIDRMAEILSARGIHSALLSAGGSSIYAIGTPPDSARGWRIAIQDPIDSSKSAATVFLKDESLSTSGGYEKFFEVGGKTYSHIMDPRTGYPVKGMLAVSVVCPRTLDSEIWAKPFYVLGRAWTEEHVPQGFRVFLCEGSGTESCSWVGKRAAAH